MELSDAADYKGDTVSTIDEERAHSVPSWSGRWRNTSSGWTALRLGNPKTMDVSVPANMRQGRAREQIAQRGWVYTTEQAKALIGRHDVALIDLPDQCERQRRGEIPGALHLPYHDLTKGHSAYARGSS